MKFHEVVKNGQDEYYTPKYAILPIIPYLKPNSKIWCPFDTKDSLYVKTFEEHGFDVVYSHIDVGQDFMTTPPPK